MYVSLSQQPIFLLHDIEVLSPGEWAAIKAGQMILSAFQTGRDFGCQRVFTQTLKSDIIYYISIN